MAQRVADPCRNCGAELAPGAPFCTLCGTAVTNRAANPAPQHVPLGGPAASGNAAVPGIIPVGSMPGGPLVPPSAVGPEPRLAAGNEPVPGAAGRRLLAWLIDAALPGILVGSAAAVGAALIRVTPVGNQQVVDFTWLGILLGVAALLSLAYYVLQWMWEAKTGKTIGNVITSLRTTNMEGNPAGVLAIFLRLLIVSASSIVPTIGPLLVILSNSWDANGKRQGWHDKVAHTLVFNVKAGRNPLETGGIAEREAFTPAEVPTLAPVSSPLLRTPERPEGGLAHTQVPGGFPGVPMPAAPAVPAQAETRGGRRRNKKNTPDPFAQPPIQFHNQHPQPFPAQQVQQFAPPVQAPQEALPVADGPITSVPGITAPTLPDYSQQAAAARQPQPAPQQPAPQSYSAAPTAAQLGAAADADDDAGETRVRPVSAGPTVLRLTFDDGRSEDVGAMALIGRNPAGYDGEMIGQLISVADSSRSVSKTHLHIRSSAEGLWVTDRNSTNGSAVTNHAGVKTPLAAGAPVLAVVGSRVYFGDRSFVVGRP